VKLGFPTFWIVAALGSFSLAGVAFAGDAASTDRPKTSQLSSKVDQQIDQAAGSSSGAGEPSDLNARVDDLEATRSAIDQKKPPTVSLSVSGWVTQQVQINGKQ
jgi:hypothetical protein